MNRHATRFAMAIAVLVMSVHLSYRADARGIHYGAVSDPALLACDRQQWGGLLPEAAGCYQSLLYADIALALQAEAAWALGDLQHANRLYRDAVRENPADAATRSRWGDLYAASHQDGEAMNLYREALAEEPSNAFARLGAATLLAGRFDAEANDFLESVLDDPDADDGAKIGAWLLLARVALENGNRDQADEALRRAGELVEKNDWPPLEIYALRAAQDLLNNITDSPWTDRSLALNPNDGAIYAVPAHFYVITRRYREAIDLYQRAVETQPDLAAAHEQLGVNLLRDNQMSRARGHLERAYALDPFSPRAVNTLRLMDSYDNFRLVDVEAGPGEPGQPPIVLRLHEEEADVMAPYAIRLTRDSIREFSERYDFELLEPVVVEMYPDHEDFAVRTAGMPGIGILGATFGYVVAMDSPSSRPPDQYQWGTTLWHEMAHVFTLEASNHLVPRWFSEGVSVLEEWRSGPHAGVRIPLSVYSAMRDERFLPIDELDEGFMRPSYPEQVIVSYMQAGLVCLFIDREFGAETLASMLVKFRDGASDTTVIESAVGLSVGDFDRRFAAFVEAGYGPLLEGLDEWHEKRVTMTSQYASGDWTAAIDTARQLLEIFPDYIETDSPYIVLAMANDALGEREQAIDALRDFMSRGGYDPVALRQLADWEHEAGRQDAAIAALQVINLVQPLDRDLHGTLGDLLLERGDDEAALSEYKALLALDPHDKASAYFRIARAYHALGRPAESRGSLLMSLDIAPNYRPAQKLLLELMRAERDENMN